MELVGGFGEVGRQPFYDLCPQCRSGPHLCLLDFIFSWLTVILTDVMSKDIMEH